MSDDLQQRIYPEDERLREVSEDPDRRMTRAEWEREESLARQAAHKRHEQVAHDREVQQDYDKHHRHKRRNWRPILFWAAVGIAVLLLIFFIGYLPRHNRNKRIQAEAQQRERENPRVDVVKVSRTAAPGQLTVPGTTSSFTDAYVFARANGYVKKRFVDIGDHVRKGQLLALIDAPELDQQVDQAREQLRQAEAQEAQQQAQLDLSRVTWERWRTLVAKGVFSRQDGDQRETDYRTQLATVASSQRNVESYRANLLRVIALQSYERVTAPFDGVVTQRNADVGALVGSNGAAMSAPNPTTSSSNGGTAGVASANNSGSSGSTSTGAAPTTGGAQGGAIFVISQIDTLRILVSVPEGYATSVRKGMNAAVFVQERMGGPPVQGTVTRTADSLDQNTRTMLTEVDIDNRGGKLFPGMYTVVSFQQVRGEAPLAVPGDAVVIRNDRTTLAVVDPTNHVHMTPVSIGRDYGPSVEIVSGLRDGDTVITSVTDDVREGAVVRPQLMQRSENDATGKGAQAQTHQTPDSGPNQYGDQSIVNSQAESTNNQGKRGQNNGTSQQGQNVQQHGPQQKADGGKSSGR
ncbi:efflux RND transporter periplasmic adaptor subunit [Terriglobus aquaticus]|uniref:Efflux RND transporter periplasmic adaptor subunit n=1 Tax=Terriglobus aquaticus TaxID=940139 RepID=A0ABW9KJV3_9BACT|nr:efflux RND transporter periplasmic adaptor subunit [Terriglobus aquaticus]